MPHYEILAIEPAYQRLELFIARNCISIEFYIANFQSLDNSVLNIIIIIIMNVTFITSIITLV